MAKSILQEVATLNAQMFNEAKLKSNIQGLEENIDRYHVQIEQLAHKLENDYKIIVANLLEETTDSNEKLRAEMTQLDINVQSLQKFTIDEIAKYFYNTGSMKKEYRRSDVKIKETIEQLQLQKLEYFTGPILEPTYNDEDLQKPKDDWNVLYPTGENRNWVYIDGSKLMYAEYSFVALGIVDGKNTVTIGDNIRYSNTYFPGTVKIQSDTNIANGVLKILSPKTTDDSIDVNGNIISDFGYLHVETGVSTEKGNITTGSGNISTKLGNLNTDSGKLFVGNGSFVDKNNNSYSSKSDFPNNSGAFQGYVYTGLGYVSKTGGFTNIGAGDISTGNGDILTEKGNISCTGNITTVNGDIHISDTGSFISKSGNFEATNGNFIATDGDFHSLRGDLILDDGGISASDDITVSKGDLILSNGDLNVTGDGTITSDLTVNRDITIGRNADVASNLTVKGRTTLSGSVTMDGDLNVKTLTVSGASTLHDLSVGKVTSTSGASFNDNVVAPNFYAGAGGTGYFYGTATKARYADLAEKYESDNNYIPGTVLSIGLDTEVTIYDENLPYAGVVSTNPAYLMNNKPENINYVDVALKGRVPVLTRQFITRGMYIVPDLEAPGYCIGLTKQEFDKQSLPLIGICVTPTIGEYVEVKV